MAGQAETGAAGQLAHGGMSMNEAFGGTCLSCGRYGFACQCPAGVDTIIRRAAEARDAEEKRRQADLYDRKPPTITDWVVEQPKRPPEPELTAHDFVVWMRGFFAGRTASPIDPQLEALLRATLARVRS